MDSNSRRKIRKLKTGLDRRAARTSSVEEPLINRAEEGLAGVPAGGPFDRQATLGGGAAVGRHVSFQEPQSPVERPRRSGRELWELAFARLQAVREEEEGCLLGGGGAGGPLYSSSSIIDKFMFNLHSKRLSKTTSTVGALAGIESEEIYGHPGTISVASDLSHLGNMLIGSYLNVLLLAIPVGLAAGYLGLSPTLVFAANFISLLPLALILGEITEDLALRFGDSIGGLLNATFGNVVEMILGLAALSRGLYTVVAASLIGSILSNLLLVLGCCFLFGGIKYKHQSFNALANKVASSLLFLACIAIITPTMAKSVYGEDVMTPEALQNLSHAVAILLMSM